MTFKETVVLPNDIAIHTAARSCEWMDNEHSFIQQILSTYKRPDTGTEVVAQW